MQIDMTRLNVTRLGDHMAAAVEGIDLSKGLDSAERDALRQTLWDNLVLCILGQSLSPAAFRDAMRTFGEPMPAAEGGAHPEVPELNIISHESRDLHGLINGKNWHSDQSFRPAPAALTMLYGVEVPETGGDTQFTNMYAAYDALPDAEKRKLDGLRVVHRYRSPREGTQARQLSAEREEELGEVIHPIVRTHPETGRKALYLNRNRMVNVIGLDHDSSERLLDELVDHATQPQFQYRHKWRLGDIVIWDNRCTMHKANGDYPKGARRVMHRMMTQGEVPV